MEDWLKQTILSLEGFISKPTDEDDARRKIDELQNILEQLEQKEKTVKNIHCDCEQYGAQYGDVQKFIKELLLGLTSNIQVIRENQNCIRAHLEKIEETSHDMSEEISPRDEIATGESIKINEKEEVTKYEKIAVLDEIRPETHAMSTQTASKPSTDNIMVIQSMDAEGETIQIYNVPCSHEDGSENERNVIVEAKYVRGHPGETKRASELVLRNVPKHFETTFVEPDETTTEIIVDPDGSKRIIVRKLTKTTQQIVTQGEYDSVMLPDHIRSHLGISGTTHDVISGSLDDPSFEQHVGITESSLQAVIEHVTHRVIKKTRKIIKKIVTVDGEEHITEEVIEEPDEVEEFTEEHPAIEYEVLPVSLDIPEEEKIIAQEEVQKMVELPENASPEHVVQTQQPEKIPEEVVGKDLIFIENVIEYSEPTEVIAEIAEHSKIISPDSQPELELKPEEPKDTQHSEGENKPQQVFETVTEAPVELIASEVDKLAPIEDITKIWPYETPHIASQTTTTENTEVSVPMHQDNDSQDVWPQNLSIGSHIDFKEYSFDRTLEKSTDYLDNENFVTIDTGLDKITGEISKIESRFAEDKADEIEPLEILPQPDAETEIAKIQNIDKLEGPTETIILPVASKIDEPEIKLQNEDSEQEHGVSFEIVHSNEDIELQQDRPMSPPQMATVTIVKTMTFLEQERINYESSMFVTKEPIVEELEPAEPLVRVIDENLEALSIEATTEDEKIIENVLDASIISQADRSLSEEIVQYYVDTQENNFVPSAAVTKVEEMSVEETGERIIIQTETSNVTHSEDEQVQPTEIEQASDPMQPKIEPVQETLDDIVKNISNTVEEEVAKPLSIGTIIEQSQIFIDNEIDQSCDANDGKIIEPQTIEAFDQQEPAKLLEDSKQVDNVAEVEETTISPEIAVSFIFYLNFFYEKARP